MDDDDDVFAFFLKQDNIDPAVLTTPTCTEPPVVVAEEEVSEAVPNAVYNADEDPVLLQQQQELREKPLTEEEEAYVRASKEQQVKKRQDKMALEQVYQGVQTQQAKESMRAFESSRSTSSNKGAGKNKKRKEEDYLRAVPAEKQIEAHMYFQQQMSDRKEEHKQEENVMEEELETPSNNSVDVAVEPIPADDDAAAEEEMLSVLKKTIMVPEVPTSVSDFVLKCITELDGVASLSSLVPDVHVYTVWFLTAQCWRVVGAIELEPQDESDDNLLIFPFSTDEQLICSRSELKTESVRSRIVQLVTPVVNDVVSAITSNPRQTEGLNWIAAAGLLAKFSHAYTASIVNTALIAKYSLFRNKQYSLDPITIITPPSSPTTCLLAL